MKYILFTQPNCEHCSTVKDLLDELKVEYQEQNIAAPMYRKNLFEIGATGVPTVVNPKTKQFIMGAHLDQIEEMVAPQKRSFEKVSLATWQKAKPDQIDENQWKEIWKKIGVPQRSTSLSSGYDFEAPYGFTLAPGEATIVETGIKVYLHKDEELLIFPRSGHGFKFFTRLANTIGKIDSDYVDNETNEGHIFVKLRNEGSEDWDVSAGDKIVQGSIYKFLLVDDDSFKTGKKRSGGMGSTK